MNLASFVVDRHLRQLAFAKEARVDHFPEVRLDVKVPLVVPRLDLAPRLEEMDVASTSVRQQSHIHLTGEQFEKAVRALLASIER